MILEIALIIILIVIIALIIKYIYVQAHILSSKEFRKTAEKKASKIKINTADITCDYCGCLIHTKEHKVCPNCGAVYGDDKELKTRFKVDEASIEKMADDAAKKAVSKAHKSGLETLKQLRIAIFALVGVFVLGIVFYAILDVRKSTDTPNYRGNEEVKEYDYFKYRLVDEPDVTVLDQGGVTLRITSVYAFTLEGEPEDSPVGYRVGFSLVSKREKPVHLFLRCVGINGRCDSMDYIHIYSEFDKKAEVTFYQSAYISDFDKIYEMVIGEIQLSDEDGDIYKNSMETIKLNDKEYTAKTDDKDVGTVIFENEKVRIRCIKNRKGRDRYEMWFENLSDINYYIDNSEMKIDGKECRAYILNDAGLPAGYTLHHETVSGLDEEYDYRTEDAVVEVSFSFTDPVDPSNNFSTGYLTLVE